MTPGARGDADSLPSCDRLQLQHQSLETNSGSLHKTNSIMSTIAILWPMEPLFKRRAHTRQAGIIIKISLKHFTLYAICLRFSTATCRVFCNNRKMNCSSNCFCKVFGNNGMVEDDDAPIS